MAGPVLAEPERPEQIALSDLPEEALFSVIRRLDARQVAVLLVQDRRLRSLASDGALWQSLAQERWPGCSAEHYGGDWHRLYRSRAALPAGLVREADRYHALTLRAANGAVRLNSASVRTGGAGAGGGGGGAAGSGGGAAGPGSPSKANVYGFAHAPYCNVAGMLLEDAMGAAFAVGLALAGGAGRAPEAAAEVERFRRDAAWWLANKADVMVRFVRRAADALREFDMWGSGFSAWPDVPWRRSALQFILDLPLGPDAGVCVSVTDRLQREAATLDTAIRGLKGEACHLDVRLPADLPRGHWWYFMAGSAR
ncbi:MAG: hypothetical protein J3K34DRAFT_456761 [Monoraphidium minutum]|nr:MAG: hypothetical protein J3K34DRAFT_456761 [Monoraphidium minutum]